MNKQNILLLILLLCVAPLCASSGSASSSAPAAVTKSKKSDGQTKEAQLAQEQKKEKEGEPESIATHCLFIFLDDSEKEIGSIAAAACEALVQKVPMLVSTHVLKNILINTPTLAERAKQTGSKKYQDLDDYYTRLVKRVTEIGKQKITDPAVQEEIIDQLNKEFPAPPFDYNEEVDEKGKKSLLAGSSLFKQYVQLHFKQDEWIIRFVDSAQRLCLMIPKDAIALGSFNKSYFYEEPTQQSGSSGLTELEFVTGLKIDHMRVVKDMYKELAALKLTKLEAADYYLPLLWNQERENKTKTDSSDIFVSRAEYLNAKRAAVPRWALYMEGHGMLGLGQAGLRLNDFVKMLDFYNRRINTALLVYLTCYAIGTNVKLIHNDVRRPEIGKSYSYVIATEGLADAVSEGYLDIPLSNFKDFNIDFSGLQRGGLFPDKSYYFLAFVFNATDQSNVNWRKTIEAVIPPNISQATIPYYRPAGKEWFNLLDEKNQVAQINNVFARTCKVVDLENFFTKNGEKPRLYLLNTHIVPCHLIFSFDPEEFDKDLKGEPYLPLIAPSALAKNPKEEKFVYYIEKITAPLLSLEELIGQFTKAVPENYRFYLYVNSLQLKAGGITLSKHAIQISDLYVFHYHDDEEKIFKLTVVFRYNGRLYSTFSLEKEPQLIAVENEKKYLDGARRIFQEDFKQVSEFKKEREQLNKALESKLKKDKQAKAASSKK
jgi:hypothetical protein